MVAAQTFNGLIFTNMKYIVLGILMSIGVYASAQDVRGRVVEQTEE